MSTKELISARPWALEKHRIHIKSVMKCIDAQRCHHVEEFARVDKAMIKDWNFK
jgi:hypothetical protein